MYIKRQFPGVHWVWGGGISFVYEVHPLIVVKVPKSGQEERENFQKELKIYEILSRHSQCPSIVECFYYTTDGIFLGYMRDISLAYKRQFNLTRDHKSRVVTGVGKLEPLEPLELRKTWINDLAQGVAFLGSLNLAHGDLRAENVLLDRNRVKLSDFDYTAEFGTDFETCPCPYGRLLNSNEADQGMPGTAGFLGPRTEQFALGSLFYLIYYGFEVYDDQYLVDDPCEHGPKVMDLLQDMKFPKLDGEPVIDGIIYKCWHKQYRTLSDLATYTETLLKGSPSDVVIHGPTSTQAINSDGYYKTDQNHSVENFSGLFSSKREFCQDLEKRGLLRLLTLSTPTELGFSMEHRHVSSNTQAN